MDTVAKALRKLFPVGSPAFTALWAALALAFLVPFGGIMGLAGWKGLAWTAAWEGLLCALAPFLLGGAVGFLFGLPQIPRTAPAESGSADTVYRPSGHLEAVSDWLTKIIVGVGLAQWNTFMVKFWGVASLMSCVFRGDRYAEEGKLIAACALTYFGLLGFLVGYLATRLVLADLLARADLNLGKADPGEVERISRIPINPVTGNLEASDPVASRALAAYPMSSFKTPKALSAWAKAKLDQGDRHTAITAMEQAVRMDTKDPALLRDLAAMVRPEDATRSANLLKEAADLGEDPTRLSARMLVALYKAPPQGFQEVISTLEPRIEHKPYSERADLHAFLACAYGQKAADFLETQQAGKADEGFKQISDQAFTHVQAAIALDREGWKATLAGCLHPASAAMDDDLKAFEDETRFKELLG